MSGWLKSPVTVSASSIGEGASLLKPAAQRRLDLTVDIPTKDHTC